MATKANKRYVLITPLYIPAGHHFGYAKIVRDLTPEHIWFVRDLEGLEAAMDKLGVSFDTN
ncbi:MAG TPA: hypothetical protein ENF32_03000 [Thermosulfidibacter takaii]|uniref:Uncharacterized protein n=1 Tax=Thermosulfidibacter takaii TaxID=412593 RepID=A0A7C0YDL0_9BACT|nr:hypothetical protein [Thermosulfidibacter takaii]